MTTSQSPKPVRNKPIGRFYEIQQEVKIPDDYVLTSKIHIKPLTRKQLIALQSAETEEDSNRIFLGEHAEEIFELYADRPSQEWAAFVADVYKHLMGPGINDVEGKSGES